MRIPWVLGLSAVAAFLWWQPGTAEQTTASASPTSYRAVSSRTSYPEPALPAVGPAGFRFWDPTFGSPIVRVTDANTRPGSPNGTFTTPSAAHQFAWNANSTRFYVRSLDGWYFPYTFDPITMTVARISPTADGEGGLRIFSVAEPQFSFLSPNTLYVTGQDGVNDWPVIRRFNFDTLAYEQLLNVGDVTTVEQHTYAAALSSSRTTPEKVALMFGGIQQNKHFKVVVFSAAAPATTAIVLDTQALTITPAGGAPVNATIPKVFLHHVWLEQSGRYVVLEAAPPREAAYYVWDLNSHAITAVTMLPSGHIATGFQQMVNQDCCTTTSWDAAQWQLRSLAAPDVTTDLITPVLSPQEINLAEHTSWNNAQPLAAVPILSSTYRYGINGTPWRAWDDEIVAIQTNAGSAGGTVWRFAHHRSDIAYDGSSTASYFWYLPRASISPNGWWALFTSNWEKTLGAVGPPFTPEPGGGFRSDVFLVALTKGGLDTFTDDPLVPGVTSVRAVHITELRTRIDSLRSRFGLEAFSWSDPLLGPTIFVRAAHLTELRTALQEAYVAAGPAAPVYADPSIVPGATQIRVVHIQELRDAIITLETS